MAGRRVADDLADVAPATRWADERLAAAGASDELRNAVGVCVEEALANLILHGRAADATDKAIDLDLAATGAGVTLTIRDSCAPFDIAGAAIPGAPSHADMRVGGQGLRLLRGFASTLDYRSAGGRNVLTLTFDGGLMTDPQ